MISENDSSGDDEVPLEVSNEIARRQTLENGRLQFATSKSKKPAPRPKNKTETPARILNGDESDSSDELSDAISEVKSTEETSSKFDNRANGINSRKESDDYLNELMTDDESSNSGISEMENEEDDDIEPTRQTHHIDHADGETVGTHEDVSTPESEMNLMENKGKNPKRKALISRKNVPVQWKNGTNISSVNENSSSSIDSLIASTSRSLYAGRKKFTIRRADKANRVANRSLYRKPAAALALNFKERMLYSTTRVARINGSTLLANRERRNHI